MLDAAVLCELLLELLDVFAENELPGAGHFIKGLPHLRHEGFVLTVEI